MQVMSVVLSISIIAVTMGVIAAYIFVKADHLQAWLRYLLAGGTLCGSVFLALIAFDVSSYKAYKPDTELLAITFKKQAESSFYIRLTDADLKMQEHEVDGQIWRMSARFIDPPEFFSLLGMLPVYRLELLQSRYLTQERQVDNLELNLVKNPLMITYVTGRLSEQVLKALGFNQYLFTSDFMPMTDSEKLTLTAAEAVELVVAKVGAEPAL